MSSVRRIFALAALATLTACGSARAPVTQPPIQQPAQSVSPLPAQSASPLPAASTRCVLGFDPAGRHVAHVTITNTGSDGFTLNTYAIEIDYQNSPAGYEQLTAGTFLAPGESFDHWVYLDGSSFPVMSTAAFEQSTCRVPATS